MEYVSITAMKITAYSN